MKFVFGSNMFSSPWGGSEELWSRAALRLRSEGHHVAATVKWWPQMPTQIDNLVKQGIEVLALPPADTRLSIRAWRRVKSKLGWKEVDHVERWFLEQKPDLVCISNGGNSDGLTMLELCLHNRLPYVSVIQANSDYWWPTDAYADRLIPVYQNARRAFFVAHVNRTLFESQLGIALPHAEVVRNPVNVRWDAAPPWPQNSDGWSLACIGRFEPNAKGQDLLFHILASERWRERNATLSLFGSGPMEQGLRRLATKLNLGDRVRFVGQVSDIEHVWATHHALLLSSRYEGLPLVLVESMLCSRPAIITAVAGDGEMVEEGVTGFVAPAPTVELVAAAMERAWERRADWQQMGKAARQRAESLVPNDQVGHFCERLKSCVHL